MEMFFREIKHSLNRSVKKTIAETQRLSPAQTTKFSLTSSLVAFLARVHDEQAFFNNFP